MKIQCDACEKAEAVVLCCADEAALCWDCDEKVHAANKLAGKHQRVPLLLPSAASATSKLPGCDICQIMDVPLALWTPSGISKLASFVGVPLSVDSLTAKRSRLNFARICVQISTSSPLPEEIPIDLDGEELVLKVIYDWKPVPCETCGSLVHPVNLCPSNPNPPPAIPPRPTRRGRSISRHPRSQSSANPRNPTLPPTSHGVPEGNYAASLASQDVAAGIVPPVLIPPNPKEPIIPNLNSPTEDSSSYEHVSFSASSAEPNIALCNKFTSLPSGEPPSLPNLGSSDDHQEIPPSSSSSLNLSIMQPTQNLNPPPRNLKPSKAKSAKKVKPSSSKSQ
ncbi:hypothetical protein M5K25_022642 [Dendrobium thyrsiflorum]|uniref:B box-type domain-containing protein n=1 Tax=Dendrobium thyrsiflorum TaxID=117978 RepID=A0ABD0U6L9_DENTH